MVLDSIIVVTALLISYWIIYSHISVAGYLTNIILITSVALLIFHHLFAMRYHLYNKVWAYASVGELKTIVKSVTWTVIAAGAVQFVINDFVIYKRMLIVTWLVYIVFIGGSRFAWRVFRDRYIKNSETKKRTLIVGAGAAGAMIARQLNTEQNDVELWPVAFVDDDEQKLDLQLFNLPVVGKVKDIPKVVAKFQIAHIVIAIPSLKHEELNKIVEQCSETKATVQMIPRIEDLMTGKISVSNLRNVEVEDLLGREPVELDLNSIRDTVTGQVILVTGAGGSIGSELCRQLIRFAPKQLILVGHGEHSIYQIEMELRKHHAQRDVEVIPLIGDVQDKERINEIIHTYKPRKIYHAAAHKHVPLMEYNAHEAVKNNVLGTRNVAQAAADNNVDTFVLVSTDKAVNPTNVMGATKRIAEMIIQHMDTLSETKFVAVRFGNVLGSRGSVIPLFKKQIAEGGPVTVTDPEMTRYFMTIPEASRLVIQAGTLARGGEIFVLDMGEPVKIVDLAKNLIRLSGYSVEEIGIRFTGIRPGEKMYEELMNEDEVNPNQVFEKIYIGRTTAMDIGQVKHLVENFSRYNNIDLKEVLLNIVKSEVNIYDTSKKERQQNYVKEHEKQMAEVAAVES